MGPRDRRQRRRRAAVIGGAAYAAGKHRAAKEATESAPPPAEAEPPPTHPEQAAPSVTGESAGISTQALEQIKELAHLHDQGALTDEEFEREKAKLLGS